MCLVGICRTNKRITGKPRSILCTVCYDIELFRQIDKDAKMICGRIRARVCHIELL